MKKFTFEKNYTEIEIAEEIYRIDFSDDKLREYSKKFTVFFQKHKEIQIDNIEEMSVKDQEKVIDKQKVLIGGMIDTILGEGSFDKLYEASGRSVLGITELIDYLSTIIADKLKTSKNKKYSDYVNKVTFE